MVREEGCECVMRGVVCGVLLGCGVSLLVSGCGSRSSDPHEVWDRLVAEKNITAVAEVEVTNFSKDSYLVTVYAADSSARAVEYNIGEDGDISERVSDDDERNAGMRWRAKANLSPDQIDFDGLVARVPAEDDPRPRCDYYRSASLIVVPTGKTASWTACSDKYHEGSLVVDGKPVNDQVDPTDPAQVASIMENYNDIFGAGTLVQWNAGVKKGQPTHVTVIPFPDDPDCRMYFFSSDTGNSMPGARACNEPTSEDEPTIPFDLSRFSPSLVSDILVSLGSLGVQVSAIDELIFIGTPDGKLSWKVSTMNIGDQLDYREHMHGVLEPIK